ncbi:MAG TPA: DUF2264 domain-containing protein [Acidobacteriaceae bacterium]|nr:DUF2264 domain-containing protein [Acidobacteriaceae bacterium]
MSPEGRVAFNRRKFVQGCVAMGSLSAAAVPTVAAATGPAAADPEGNNREFWVATAARIARPVLVALSQRRLKIEMPVEAPHGNVADRRQYTYLEAFGRLLCGMAPWLESGAAEGEEGKLRAQFAEWARAGLDAGTDPASPDFMNFDRGAQPVVDAAFLALAIVRAPNELWHKLDAKTQKQVIAALRSSRVIKPGYNNWLLFSAMVEAALCFMGEPWDAMRVDYAVRSLDSWYKGDGVYGDGPQFHWDYYDSFVMHPLLLAVLETVGKASAAWNPFQPVMLARAQRYAEIQERMIGPEGSFPPIGRSLCYRFGAFHLLADVTLRRQLPEVLAPAQVRSALTAVMRRMVEAPGTFDAQGWLTVGFCGHQPEMAEAYISTGSCYLCSAAWLPLGLAATDPFWADGAAAWTAKKAWSGQEVRADHALSDRELNEHG